MPTLTPALPTRLQVEVTAACNLRCRMCVVRYRPPIDRRSGSITLERFISLIDTIPGLEEVTLQGIGEPLLVPDLAAMVRAAADRGIQVGFNTNATLMTARKAEELIKAGLAWLCISIDGASASTYEDIRDGARFQRVSAHIRTLVEVKSRLHSDRPDLQVVFVLMRRNVAELPAMVRLVADWGIRKLRVQNLSHTFSDTDPYGQYEAIRAYAAAEAVWRGGDLARTAEVFDRSRAEAARLGVELRLPNLEEAGDRREGQPGCAWPWESAYVNHDGAVQPCCMLMGSERARLGHLGEQEFPVVWHNDAYQEFRAALLSDDPPEVCRGCSEYRRVF